MRDAARTPALGIAIAAAMVGGALCCLLLPRLLPWPLLAAAFAIGFAYWLEGARWRMPGAFAVGFALAGLHAAAGMAAQLPRAMEQREFRLSGQVVDLPRHEPRRTAFVLRVDRDAHVPHALRGQRLRLAWYDDGKASQPSIHPSIQQPRFGLRAGSHWAMTVKLRAPRGLRNPGGIDGERHALQQRISGTGYIRDVASLRELRQPDGIDAWREAMSARIAHAVPWPTSRFVRALALGDTRGLSDTDWETLRAAGLTHLIAISGFHVGLVAGFFALLAAGLWRALPRLGRVLPRQHAAAIAALAGACVYAAVAGFALPTVRTVMMIGVLVVARLSRRAQRVTDALALATIAVLLVDPLSLLGAGFWLSFAGVAWLVWCLPAAQGAPGRWAMLRGFLSAQGVATLGLLPVAAVLFGQASLAGPLANLLAIPWWSLVVVPLSLVGTAGEALHGGGGTWPWRAAAWAFDPSWQAFQWLASGRLALWWLPESRWFALPMALAAAFWLLLPRGAPGKWLAALLWLPLLWPQRNLPRPGAVQLVVLDVGQGLSLVVRTARHVLVFDAGPAVVDGFDAGERAVVPSLHALGIPRLDAIVLSHGDNDHIGGYPALRRAMPVPLVLAPPGVGIGGTTACLAGMTWRWDGVRFTVLHPPRHFPYLKNESSCTLRVDTAHGALLLTGDIGQVIERRLVRDWPGGVRATVVQVAHHGSDESSDPDFVAATSATLALVSSGYGNRFGHPRPTVVARWQAAGARLLDTQRDGALRVAIDGDGAHAIGERSLHRRLWDATRRVDVEVVAGRGP